MYNCVVLFPYPLKSDNCNLYFAKIQNNFQSDKRI